MWRFAIATLVIACEADHGVVAPPPPRIAAPATIDAAPPPAPPVVVVASWKDARVTAGLPTPACVRAADRFVQYAELSERGRPRFCLWWNLAKAAADVACYEVDPRAGSYAREVGVWFAAPVPEESRHVDGNREIALVGARVTWTRAGAPAGELALPGAQGAVLVGRDHVAFVIDRDGRIDELATDAAKRVRTIVPPACPQ